MQNTKQFSLKYILLAGFMLCDLFMMAQPFVIKGRVVDASSGKPLAFVNIVINDSLQIGISDTAGKFTVNSSDPEIRLKFSIQGYQAAEIVPDLSGNEIVIILNKSEPRFRQETGTPELIEAQRIIDSIGRAENAGKIDKANETIIDGRPALGIFYLDINRIFHYNRYQGLYLGVGLHTNEKFSKLFSLGGFWGYGFSSKSASYGADGILVLDRHSETNLKLELSHDVSESGGMPDFGEVKRLFDPSGFHNLLVRRMDMMDLRKITVSTGIVKYLRAGISIFQSVKTPTYDYAYVRSQDAGIAVLDSQFDFSGLSFNIKYAYRETQNSKKGKGIPPGATFPIIRMQLTQGISGWFGSEYSYTRLDIKVEKSFFINHLGRNFFCVQAGAASGDLPYAILFDGRGGYGKFTIYAPQSFATMRINEFVSDRYASFFFTQNFGKLLKPSRLFNPELALSTAAGFGNLSHPEEHRGVEIRTLTKGFYESGLLINNLVDLKVYNIGLGAFYRLGPYSFPAFNDNIAFKFSLNFPL